MRIENIEFVPLDEYDELYTLIGESVVWHDVLTRNGRQTTDLTHVFMGKLQPILKGKSSHKFVSPSSPNVKSYQIDYSDIVGYALYAAIPYHFVDGVWVRGDTKAVTGISNTNFRLRKPRCPASYK